MFVVANGCTYKGKKRHFVASYAAGKKYVHIFKKFGLLISMKAKGGTAKTIIWTVEVV